jgi:hypothetical protein
MKTFLSLSMLSILLTACSTETVYEKPEESEEEVVVEETKDAELLILDSNASACTTPKYQRPEIGGWIWPVHEEYQNHSDSLLGTLFTADACGEARLDEVASDLFPSGVTESGVYLSFSEGPSSEMEAALKSLGFEWSEKYDWHLNKKVDYKTLLPLRSWVNENWRSIWGGLEE